jgi:EAL domain-containing protein (putative c-di-GMP-specific phosphodiesterase class I)
MGLRVVAEGIETPEERDVLAELGCDLAQGYCLGRPMPSAALAGFLGARTPGDPVHRYAA